jgi:hypothetical protein
MSSGCLGDEGICGSGEGEEENEEWKDVFEHTFIRFSRIQSPHLSLRSERITEIYVIIWIHYFPFSLKP